jgi:hypothetical protein
MSLKASLTCPPLAISRFEHISDYQILGVKCRKNHFWHFLCFQCHLVLCLTAHLFICCIVLTTVSALVEFLMFPRWTWIFELVLCPPFTISSWWLVCCFSHSRYQVAWRQLRWRGNHSLSNPAGLLCIFAADGDPLCVAKCKW